MRGHRSIRGRSFIIERVMRKPTNQGDLNFKVAKCGQTTTSRQRNCIEKLKFQKGKYGESFRSRNF